MRIFATFVVIYFKYATTGLLKRYLTLLYAFIEIADIGSPDNTVSFHLIEDKLCFPYFLNSLLGTCLSHLEVLLY